MILESEDFHFAFDNALIKRNNATHTCKLKVKEKLHLVQHKCDPLVYWYDGSGTEFGLVF